jgi:hypothetical protein
VARWLKVLLICAALGIVGLVVGVEVVGRVVTQRVAEDQLRAAGVAGGVEVTIGRAWFRPTVVPALLTGNLDRIAVRLQDARLYSVPVLEADYVLEDLAVEVSLSERTIRASSLGSGSVRLLVDPGAFAAVVGVEAVAEGGRMLVGPDREPAELTISGRSLVITSPALVASGGSTTLQVVDPQLLPCTPEVRVLDGLVELSCRGDSLPGILERTLGVAGVEPEPSPPTELEPPATLELPTTTTVVPPTAPADTAPADTAPAAPGPEEGNDGGG